jgi:hypothetical protein
MNAFAADTLIDVLPCSPLRSTAPRCHSYIAESAQVGRGDAEVRRLRFHPISVTL